MNFVHDLGRIAFAIYISNIFHRKKPDDDDDESRDLFERFYMFVFIVHILFGIFYVNI